MDFNRDALVWHECSKDCAGVEDKYYTYSNELVAQVRNVNRLLMGRQKLRLLNGGGEVPAPYAGEYTCSNQPDPQALVVGEANLVTLWNDGSTINYTILANTFPNETMRQTALTAFSEAAYNWTNAGFTKIKLVYTDRLEDSKYTIRFQSTPSGNTVASTFKPNLDDVTDVNVYPLFYQLGGSTQELFNRQVNTMQHEIGHIFGLRHEFALTGETNRPAIQIGDPNPLSIMSYNADRTIQPSDVATINVLYTLYPPSQIGTFRIERIAPNN